MKLQRFWTSVSRQTKEYGAITTNDWIVVQDGAISNNACVTAESGLNTNENDGSYLKVRRYDISRKV